MTHKTKCVHKCAPEHPLYDPEVHTECSYKNGTIISEIFETTNKLDLRQSNDQRIGMYIISFFLIFKWYKKLQRDKIWQVLLRVLFSFWFKVAVFRLWDFWPATSKKWSKILFIFLLFGYFPPSGRTHQSGSNPNQIQIQSEQKDIIGSKSNETNTFDNENDNAGDDNCCQSFSLNLANEIKTKHSTREGSYILGSSIINGFKTWISSDGKTAIWYIKENLWCIGDVDNMSTSLCRLVRVSCQDLEVSASRQSFLGLGYLGREADIWVTSI